MAVSYSQTCCTAQQGGGYVSLYRTKAGYFALALAGLGFSSMYGLLPSLAILIPGNVKIGRTYVGLRTIAVTLAGIIAALYLRCEPLRVVVALTITAFAVAFLSFYCLSHGDYGIYEEHEYCFSAPLAFLAAAAVAMHIGAPVFVPAEAVAASAGVVVAYAVKARGKTRCLFRVLHPSVVAPYIWAFPFATRDPSYFTRPVPSFLDHPIHYIKAFFTYPYTAILFHESNHPLIQFFMLLVALAFLAKAWEAREALRA